MNESVETIAVVVQVNDCEELIKLLNDGWEVYRADSTHEFIVYLLVRSK